MVRKRTGEVGKAPHDPGGPSGTGKSSADPRVAQWFRRVTAGERVQTVWENDYRVPDCYQYWRGNQRAEPFDQQKQGQQAAEGGVDQEQDPGGVLHACPGD